MKRNYLDFTLQMKELLQNLPELVDQLERKDVRFTGNFKEWLQKAEELLRLQQMPELATIAGIRSRIIAAEQGLQDVYRKGRQRSKAARQAAATNLPKAEQLLQATLHPRLQRVEEAQQVLQTLLLLAEERQLLRAVEPNDFGGYLLQLWAAFHADPELRSGVVKIKSLVSHSDALRLLAEGVPSTGQLDTAPLN